MNDERKRRLMQAESLLQNELFNEMMDSIEKKYILQITSSNYSDKELRDFGYMGIRAINDIKNYLQYIVKSGKLK